MEVQWFRRDKEAVLDERRRGVRPLMATTMASGPLDELIAFAHRVGCLRRPRSAPRPSPTRGDRRRFVVPDARGAAVLARTGPRPLGATAVPGAGHLAPTGLGPRTDPGRRQSPASPPRGEARPSRCPAIPTPCGTHSAGSRPTPGGGSRRPRTSALYRRRLVRGKVYAIDGSGLGNDFRLVCLVCVSAQRPVIVAWRLLERGRFGEGPRGRGDAGVDRAGPAARRPGVPSSCCWPTRCTPTAR